MTMPGWLVPRATPRPIGQLRAGVLADLVLRPWDTTRPLVTAHLTVIAPLETITTGVAGHDACAVGHLGGCGCAEPAQVDGQPITPEGCRPRQRAA